MISKPSLDCKYPVGNGVSHPVYQDGTTIIPSASPDMTNSDIDLNVGASAENMSAKFKYPSVSEDAPEAGRNQYQ